MKRRLPILVLVAFVGLLAGCATLPPPTDRVAVAGADRHRADAAGPGGGAAAGGASRPVRLHALRRPARCLRGARAARPPGRALARRAVLHLARRRGRHAAVGGDVAGRRARRARAPAGRRRQQRRARPDARGARRAPEHRAAPVQPLRQPRIACPRLPHRLQPAQPAHAQQVLHRRQPGQRGRRPQHRRRILRRRRGAGLCRHGRDGHRPGGAGGLARVRPVLEQCLRLPGRALRRAAPRRPGGGAATALRGRAAGPARRAVPAGGTAGAVRPGIARAPAGVRLGHRPGAVRRPRQDARRQRGQRPAAAAGADAAHGLAAEAAGHHLALLRARRRGHRHAGARWPGAACRCAC